MESSQKMRSIYPTNKTLLTILKRKVGNCCIQRTEPIEQKKGNRIKMSTPVEVRAS